MLILKFKLTSNMPHVVKDEYRETENLKYLTNYFQTVYYQDYVK